MKRLKVEIIETIGYFIILIVLLSVIIMITSCSEAVRFDRSGFKVGKVEMYGSTTCRYLSENGDVYWYDDCGKYNIGDIVTACKK